MLAKLKANWPVVILILVSVLLCVRNYTPGTFLSGWDTLHPEFNFGLAFERTIFGVFRTEQGLGAVAGHSHMADLPRILILYISHFVLPLESLRYFYIFLNIILGCLGMYFFLNKHLLKEKTASFLGGLFYLLNVGTVQLFNVPFEMFTTLFATLPFVFYFATSYISEKEDRTRNLFLFAVFIIFTSPAAYAATLWYAFFACFIIYFFSLSLILSKQNKTPLKSFVVLISVVIALNLFWLMPNIYFVINHGVEVAHANINLLFSDQAFLKNKEFGNIKDILLLKTFYFDWSIYNGNNFTDLLSSYINYFKDVRVLFTAYTFGLSFIFGALYLIKKLKLKSLPFFLVLLFCLLFLVNDNFPFSPIFNFFQNHIPFFKEALRFPDDKVFNIFVFLVSIFFGFTTLFIIDKLKKINLKRVRFELVFALVVSILIVFYSLPSFYGNFINYYMRVQIPTNYFELFDYLNTQPDSLRVANLPIESPWGWVYYNWYSNKPSYQGAGFLYFGIKQPLLDRDFDRWNPYNESYYREMSYAVYKGDKKLLINVIRKYKIGIIFIDKNVTDPQNQKGILYFDESKRLIMSTGLVKDERIFGQIDVFKMDISPEKVSAVNTNINVLPQTTTTYEDFAYEDFNNYISSLGLSDFETHVFPFRDLIDNQSKLHKNIVNIDSEKITLNPSNTVDNYSISASTSDINIIPSDLIAQKVGQNLTVSIYPNTPIFDQTPLSSPIKTTISTGDKQNISLSVNGQELFNLNGIADNTPVVLGKIMLKNGDNTISAFNSDQITPVNNPLSVLNPVFYSCAGQSYPAVGITQNGISLLGKGDVCIQIPYQFLTPKAGSSSKSILTNLSFNFDSNAKIASCLLNMSTQNCLYYINPQREGNIVSLSYAIAETQTQNTAIKIFIQPQNASQNKYLLNDINFSYTNSFSDSTLSKNDMEKIFIDKQTVSFNKIYLSKNVIESSGFDIANTNNYQNGCPSKNSNAQKEIVTQGSTKAIKYFSSIGSYCDHFSYPNLIHNQGYLVAVYSENKSGLPMTLCISNDKTRRCDVYSDLSSFKAFNKDVFLLPPMNDNGIGYNINFENIGINKSPAENLISSVEFIPIPYQFLENIKTQTTNSNSFNGKIESVIEYNPSLYLVSTNGKKTSVTLYLSFEKGFKAYSINCLGQIACFLETSFAPIFGKEIKEHVVVDNWANGWITNSSKVAIIFLPQYFEYLGFILILITLLLTATYFKNKN